jgi:lysophospholipase L1-like esterase
MCAGIRDAAINGMLDSHSDDSVASDQVKVERHLGATADEIRFYSKYNIQLLRPQSLVVVAGANDVSGEDLDNPDAATIAHRIAQIARDARDAGVPQAFLMGIVPRRDKRYSVLISRVNLALRYVCTTEGFTYIDNTLIGVSDLQRDGLHVNYEGKKKLMHNILSCCSSYNPSYGYMWDNLNKWGVHLNC